MSKLIIPKHCYNFVLVLSGVTEETNNLEDALFEAGCDDALINIRNNTVYLDFDREATDFKEAIISGIKAVERAGIGARVVRVEPGDIVNISEIAKRCNLSRQAISLFVNAQRGDKTFPAPIAQLDKKSALWQWSVVARWLYEHRKISEEQVYQAEILERINEALPLRDERVLSEMQEILNEIDLEKRVNMV